MKVPSRRRTGDLPRHAPVVPQDSNLTFIQRINELEDRKMELFLQGGWFDPLMLIKIQQLDKKLEKYYRWYSTAIMSGVI